MKRKLLAMLLSVVMVMSLVLPAAATNTEETRSGDSTLTWGDLQELAEETEDGDALMEDAAETTGDEDAAEEDSDAPVTQQELVAFLLLFSGMKESQLGDYPYDYNCMAESAGLTDGLDYSAEEVATMDDLNTMLENVQPLYDAMHAETKEPLFINGKAQPIFEYTSGAVEEGYSNEDSEIIRYCVYVETNYDTDGDGKLDLVKALVQIPRAAMEGDYQAATIYEARPYITGCTDLYGYDENLYNDDGYDISSMYAQPAARKVMGTATTELAAKQADSSDWYYWNEYEQMYDYEDLTWYDYYLVRGFAVVECGGLGTLGSEGFETCGTDLEIDAFKCVIEWLHGDRVAYTDTENNIAIEADWSNGKVGMTGRSYAGTTQFGLATTGVEGLETIVPVAGIASWYEYTNSQGISTRSDPSYSDNLAGYCAGRKLDEEDWSTITRKYGAYLQQIRNDQLELNGDYGEHWAIRDYTLDAENIQCPALIVHGLNDENVRTKEFDLMYQAYQTAGQEVKLLLHQNGHLTPTYPAGGTECYIGDELYDDILNKWFSHYLYDVDNGIEDMAAVTVQDNVDGSWDTYDSWEAAGNVLLKASESSTVTEETTTVTSEGMSSRTWTADLYTTGNTANSATYLMDVTEDTTIEGSVAVHIKATTSAEGRDAVKMSAYLVDVSDTEFNVYNRTGSYLPNKVIMEGGAWMGGGLENYDLVEYQSTTATYKIIAKGWMDLANPSAGYDSASATRENRVELKSGTYYDYTLYLQPNLYTVQAGHRLALVIFTDTREASEAYTITIDNTATYADIPVTKANEPEPVKTFEDVTEDDYFYTEVMWAAENGIVNGMTDTQFQPEGTATRAQMATMIWRAAGEPAATITELPFTDVPTDAYYYNAVLWAYENGVIKGVSSTEFDPDAPVTRGQVVAMLYRYAGSPEVSGSVPFTDVQTSAYYYSAVLWAYANNVAQGTNDITFAPDNSCKRCDLAIFLYRFCNLDKDSVG